MYIKQVFSFDNVTFKKEFSLYLDPDAEAKACLLYLHGGGLLFGTRDDLPETHLKTFTEAGYPIITIDYPLAPAAKLPDILDDILNSIDYLSGKSTEFFSKELPFVLWGRSAGGWLSLLTASKLSHSPAAVLSYYGYGLLCDGWNDVPSDFYRTFPKLDASCMDSLSKEFYCSEELGTHYFTYVYSRQTGLWKDLVYKGRDKFFWRDYTLRLQETLPCPLFAAHSIDDNDVPYEEFQALCEKYHPTRFIASGLGHDFDREDNEQTQRLLSETLTFLKENVPFREN